ncbi:MAG: endolytic transglycosylase MltG [Bacteroidales bacterium]|jgi:UPF0755 protein|nr:endolytic transglycosylase MltG [Bacteroidales bacterium]
MNKKIIAVIIVFLVLTGIVLLYFVRTILFSNNISVDASPYLYIKTGDTYADVLQTLKEQHIVKNMRTFQWVANRKNYPAKVRAGRYRITQGMNNNELLNLLRSGQQDAVDFTFNNIRTKEQLAQRVAKQLETNYDSLLSFLNDENKLKKYNITTETALTIFIPNTYQLWWNTSAEDFVERMYREYQKFWNDDRLQKAFAANLSPTEVIILASIVEEENHRTVEQPRIAGLYINRLKRNMPLQADPTIKFALQDFGRKRILFADLLVDSPYNTYKHKGLPPGAIRIPSPSCVDAVLNYEKHPYLYMCAKEDFSGFHNFARTSSEHAANARKYHRALKKIKIKK